MTKSMIPEVPLVDESALPLGYKQQLNPPARPRRRDPRVIEAAARVVLAEVMTWLDRDIPTDPDKRAAYEKEVLEQLVAAIGAEPDDSYTMAKHLDRNGWSPDRELVDILDGVSLHSHHKALVEEWVEVNQIQPAFAVGDRVVHERQGAGTVVKIINETAEYVVQTERFLAAHPGQAGTQSGTIIAFEEARSDILPQADG